MNFKKIVAAFAAAAMSVTMLAASAFAATIDLDAEYVGSWGAGKCISKADLQAIGGDVKVTLNIETRNLANTADQFLIAPMDYDNSWTRVTDQLTTSTETAKADGFIAIKEAQTTCSFVITAATIDTLGDSGLGFQVQNVIIKSADLEAGSPEGAFAIIEDADIADFCFGTADADAAVEEDTAAEEATDDAAAAEDTEEAAEDTAAVTEAPAADSNTASTTTGNAPVAAMAIVMVAAGAVAVASKKN